MLIYSSPIRLKKYKDFIADSTAFYTRLEDQQGFINALRANLDSYLHAHPDLVQAQSAHTREKNSSAKPRKSPRQGQALVEHIGTHISSLF